MAEVFIAAGVFLLLLFVARGASLVHWSLLMSTGAGVTTMFTALSGCALVLAGILTM